VVGGAEAIGPQFLDALGLETRGQPDGHEEGDDVVVIEIEGLMGCADPTRRLHLLVSDALARELSQGHAAPVIDQPHQIRRRPARSERVAPGTEQLGPERQASLCRLYVDERRSQ